MTRPSEDARGDDEDPHLTSQLLLLEKSLWRSATRFDRGWMERVLHPQFHEFGRSGRRWSREDILGLPAVAIDVVWPPQHLGARLVSPDVALLTYVVVDAAGTASNRSSLWVRTPPTDGADPHPGWLLRFHHGGPAAP